MVKYSTVLKKINALSVGALFLFLMSGMSSCTPAATGRRQNLTDDCKFVEYKPGETTCKELFIIHNVNKKLNESCNKDMAQIRKHQ